MVRIILLNLLLAATFLAQAGDETLDRATLKGVKAVSVIIDRLPPDLPKEGVTADALQTRLTQRLNDANIPIDLAAKEFVGLRASSVRASRGPYAVSITIGFYQPATLVRDKSLRIAPQTWDVDTVMLAEPKQLYAAAMESVDDLAARFIAAYRSVNPQ
jgi:hypothetical protein